MQRLPKHNPRQFSSGMILLLAMVFLLLLALVSSTLMRSALLETRMAGNNQFREEAFQLARGVVEKLSLESEYFALERGPGFVRCTASSVDEGCDERDLPELSEITVAKGLQLDYRVERQSPRVLHSLPIREAQESVSSADRSAVALFEIEASIDGSDDRLGNARLVRGMAVRLPSIPTK